MDKPSLLNFQSRWHEIVDLVSTKGVGSLSWAEGVWYTVATLDAAINDGGFISYFYNNGADDVMEALTSLDAIGAKQTKYLLLRCMELFPPGFFPASLEARNEAIDSFPDNVDDILSDLDQTFYDQDEELGNLLVAFILEQNLAAPEPYEPF